MPKRSQGSKLLVIDASVIRSAGRSEHPTSRKSREALDAVLEICHRAYVCPTLQREWIKHHSEHGDEWQASMRDMGKLVQASDPPMIEALRKAIEGNRALEKDVHLVEAAVAAGDRVIVSLDKKARDGFTRLKIRAEQVDEIQWIDPTAQAISELR
jgi:predicted nucleic acid-binding protein